MKNYKVMIFGVVLVLVLAACQEESIEDNENEDGEPDNFSIGAAATGGEWHSIAASMSEEIQEIFPESNTDIVEGGSIANLTGIHEGTFDIGFSNGEAIPLAEEAEGEFEEPIDNAKTIASLYPNPLHIVVPESSDIYEIEDLEGQNVSPGLAGYSGEVMLQDVLSLYDMDYDDLGNIEYIGTQDAAELMRDGHLDAWVGVLGPPAAVIDELDTTMGIRLIPLEPEDTEALYDMNEGYAEYTIEEETYGGLEEDILTIAPETVLIVNEDTISEDVGYEITQMMFDNQETWANVTNIMEDFDAEYSIENIVGDLHPGAERYYEEEGLLEDE
ncbi:TAXI family TRAP transporter solute-binding subunit [Salicibibacter cibarius]|uniref:TAXI family TRAP transporter solute-binding subunit n=1 Tax=Salicibibacter cibarius TaxID=2743000 RepID=A0A7T6Z7J3_9BACI|nr:TAXI family TRAP transporter solute-binding subunit [Salicibibacter cibarius]